MLPRRVSARLSLEAVPQPLKELGQLPREVP
jgi:hypothetical protein